MNIDRIKELLKLMDKNNLTEIEIEEEGLKIRLQKGGNGGKPVVISEMMVSSADAATPPAKQTPADGSADTIPAPMVGTFYTSASPEAASFIGIGDSVDADTVVCIIEAMKVMNEIKAGVEGQIAELLVENGSAVEFGQPLFRIDPA
jgi:acetyl-CoA carboxylase biotin carboxyl carrier protein